MAIKLRDSKLRMDTTPYKTCETASPSGLLIYQNILELLDVLWTVYHYTRICSSLINPLFNPYFVARNIFVCYKVWPGTLRYSGRKAT